MAVVTIDLPVGASDSELATINASASVWAQNNAAALSAITRLNPSPNYATITYSGVGAPQSVNVLHWKLKSPTADYAARIIGILAAQAAQAIA